MKYLIVNADDFGFTPDVNEGIVAAHRQGILTATTLMANGPAFDHAVRLAHENPSLDVGCHLVLVGGEGYPATIPELVRALAQRKIQVYEELSGQVRRILSAGIQPTHLDTHKHTHLLPPVLNAVAQISSEFGIPWVRRPFDFPMSANGIPWRNRLVSRGMDVLRPRFRQVLTRHGCRTTDHFAGFQMTGSYGAQELATLIRKLPEGTTEFMCHPGFCGESLRAAKTRLKESRQSELEALISPQVRSAVAEANVAVVTYRDLSPLPSRAA